MDRSPIYPTSPPASTADEDLPISHDGERSPRDGLGGHKRSVSGSLFSKLSFLNRSPNSIEGSDKGSSTEHAPDRDDTPSPGGALAGALQQQKKTRKRKGSLRKTALLGTGVLRHDNKDKKSPTSSLKNSETLPSSKDDTNDIPALSSPTSPGNDATPRPSFKRQNEPPAIDRSQKPQLLALNSSLRNGYDHSSTNSIRSPTEASTTDDDDFMTFPRIPTNLAARKPPSVSSSDSYFPLQPDLLFRRRSNNRIKSPLATHTVESAVASEDWDYGQTEFWGWIILIVTWIVFVVGMGSCLDVWVWCWDIGVKAAAPPELEDDPTLPIVGYYPALMVCTGVMSWIWAISAWVGMKYFKHANIIGDDS